MISKKKILINIDGLEYKREKWGKWGKKILCFSEKMAIKYADVIITDNKGIQNYVKESYKIESTLIAYGGNHVLCNLSQGEEKKILENYNLEIGEYSCAICRIEPENNVSLILDTFTKTRKNLVFVGNWEKSEYGKDLFKKYNNQSNIKLLPPIYDLRILYVFRSNCQFYIHGHSAGGTNPSLVEAMFFAKPILAFDVIYNRETTENKAHYFFSIDDLSELLCQPLDYFLLNSKNMLEIAERRYKWCKIAKQYESLY
jgi:glycosyltransferase involved in cell wall biosynthesis